MTALQAGVPVNLLQRWLGHARIGTTAIYGAPLRLLVPWKYGLSRP